VEAANAATPGAALRKLSELRRELEAFERRQVAQALADGASFAAIARDLGLSRQAVHRRFRDLAGAELPLQTAPEVRRVLQYAREEAATLGAELLGSEYVVLAVLRASELPAAVLLRSAGATLMRARAQVEGASPRAKLFRREFDVGDLRLLLAEPAREARERGHGRIEVEDLLIGATNDPSSGASRTLRAIGVDVDALREGLQTRLVSSA
jgi:ATP-dependent Clp protease ATP-binding subunit ClpA